MANNYASRYGETLRRLWSANRGGGALNPSTAPAGAFGPGDPGPQQGSAFGVTSTPAPQTSAFGTSPLPEYGLTSPDPEPQAAPELSAAQLWQDMPGEFKDQLENQIAGSGIDIDRTYASKVDEGMIEPPKRAPTRQEKLGYLAEVALRTLSNLSRPGTLSISDFADAKLYTDARRGAIERAEAERARMAGEKRRQEQRQDQTEQRRISLTQSEGALNRGARAAEAEAARKQAVSLAEEQRKARTSQDAARRRESEKDRKLRREEGEANRKNARDVAGLRAFNQVDADTLIREKRAAAKDIKEDRKEMKELEAQVKAGKYNTLREAIEARASDIVMSRFPGGTRPSPTATNFFDQADE